MVTVGDKVWYVPGENHCFERQPDGVFAWQFGRRSIVRRRRDEPEPNPEIVSDDEVANVLKRQRRQPRLNVRDELTPIGPQTRWEATVTALDGDTADLDILNPCLPGVTLHYTVEHDQTGDTPHTWHEGD